MCPSQEDTDELLLLLLRMQLVAWPVQNGQMLLSADKHVATVDLTNSAQNRFMGRQHSTTKMSSTNDYVKLPLQ
jgi:hypothetical protein